MWVERDDGPGRDQQCDAVRWRRLERLHGDARLRAGTILDYDGLPEGAGFAQFFGKQPRDEVDGAARWQTNEDLDRFVLCAGLADGDAKGEGEQQDCQQSREQVADGCFHRHAIRP